MAQPSLVKVQVAVIMKSKDVQSEARVSSLDLLAQVEFAAAHMESWAGTQTAGSELVAVAVLALADSATFAVESIAVAVAGHSLALVAWLLLSYVDIAE
jgi:hypothetical protein